MGFWGRKIQWEAEEEELIMEKEQHKEQIYTFLCIVLGQYLSRAVAVQTMQVQ